VIAQVANGDWRVLIGNGPNSTGGTAKLVMIDIDDGDPHIVNTDTSIDNGLTAVLARDSGSSVDYFSDTAYAGDIKGNLWKFTNLSAASPTVTKLFVAQDPSNAVQPITAAPVVAKNPLDGSIWVLFGTGQYLSESDLSTTQVQSWYGIRDSGTLVARADLVQRQVLSTVDAGQYDARTISQGTATDLVGKGGWYLDLPATGERMVVPNRIQGEVVIGTSRIPSATDICKPGGRGFVMAIDPFTGARLPNSYFDVNGDGVINASDEVGNDPTPASGIGFDSGVNNPIFADGVMLVSKDDGSSEGLAISGKSSASRRLGWRELLN
jgi:type IV pilus assembly protein PilY1